MFAPTETRTNGQRVFEFENGYGASVIVSRNYLTGEATGTFELAVLFENDITYDTPVTDDVIAGLSESDVQDTLARIASL
jgi:hypothetical protein